MRLLVSSNLLEHAYDDAVESRYLGHDASMIPLLCLAQAEILESLEILVLRCHTIYGELAPVFAIPAGSSMTLTHAGSPLAKARSSAGTMLSAVSTSSP